MALDSFVPRQRASKRNLRIDERTSWAQEKGAHRYMQKYCRKCYAFLTSDATSCRTCGSSDLIEIGKPMAGNVDFDAHAVEKDLSAMRYKIAAQKCIDSGFESMEANFIMAKLLISGKVDDMGQDELEKEVECFKKHFESIPEDERFKFGINEFELMDSPLMMRAGNNRFLGGNVMRGIAHLQAAMRQGLSFERLMRVVNICMWKNRFRQAVYLVPKFFKVLLFVMPKEVVEDVIFYYPTGEGLWRQLGYIGKAAFIAWPVVCCIGAVICGVVDFLLHTPASSIILLTTAITIAFLCVVYVICVIVVGFLRRDSIKCLSFMTGEDPYYEDPY